MNRRCYALRAGMIAVFLLALFVFKQSVQSAQPSDVPRFLLVVAEPSPTALPSGANERSTTSVNLPAAPASCTGSSCTILANTGWQQTPLTLQQGTRFTILYTGGTWTVDSRPTGFPYVGPDGYPPNIDIPNHPCKVDAAFPFARLLGQIGTGSRFSVGAGGAFTANASGVLALRINDQDTCLGDNDGAIVLTAQIDIIWSVITGRVTDANGNPIADVTMVTNEGSTTRTGPDGRYSFGDIPPGTFTVTPAKAGYTFSPSIRTVTVPPDANGVDFTAIPPAAPSANFDAWPQNGEAPLTVLMHIVSTNNITTCTWDYGDGKTGNSCAPYHDHIYTAAGSYTVKLTVSGSGGSDTMTRNNYINVTSPQVQFGTPTFTVNENGQVGDFHVITLNPVSSKTVTVRFATSNGTATAGSDYTAQNITLTFNPGESSKSFFVPILQDNLDENDETVNLTLSNPTNAALGPLVNAALTIFDDDPLPKIQFSRADYSIREDGGSAIIQVTLNPVSGRTVAVNYATSNGTASAGSDYQAQSSTFTFNPGDTSKTFSVPITNDSVVETDETVNLTLSSFGNADPGTPVNAVLTILNEDVAPCFTLTTGVNPSSAGSVAITPAPNCTGNQYAQGTVVTLSATPNAGFVFSSWSGSVGSPSNPLNVIMDGNKNITANFSPLPPSSISGRVADANNQPIAGVTVAASAYTAQTDANGNYTLQGVAAGSYTVTPSKSGYTFFPPTRPVTVPPNAPGINFVGTPPCYALVTSVNPVNWGTVVTAPAPNCQGNNYIQGTTVIVTARGNPGYEFNQWSGDANNNTNPLSVVVDRNKNITANFRQAAFTCSNVTEIPQLECEALVALHNNTNGPAWTNHTGWLATLTPCSWFGVACAGNHVTALNLADNRLTGNLPAQMGNLVNLNTLDLNINALNGAIPVELGSLANLAVLDLSINELTGSIPAQLGNLTSLTHLRLGENYLDGAIPTELSRLANLIELSLDDNSLTGLIPPELGSLARLQTLDLFWNELSGALPTQLGNLTNLTSLSLGRNQFSGGVPSEIASLVNLTTLYLDDNQFSGALPGILPNLSKLSTFWFQNTNLCEPGDSGFQAWLARISSLKRTGIVCVTADFTASPLSGLAALSVAFHNSSTGSFTNCTWEYGDGATGSSCSADHNYTYNTAGTYTVRLTVSGPGGTDTEAKSNYITVIAPNDADELVAQGDYTTVTPGESIRFWINVRNSGNTTWRAGDGYGWRGTGEWSSRSGAVWRDVPPGDVLSFAEDLTVPSQPGEYTYGFILQHSGRDFGLHFFIKVTVVSPPVVLVHGWNDFYGSWDTYRQKFLPSIGMTGYAIESMNTGFGGGSPLTIDQNAQKLADYIGWVKWKTGVKKVDIVAHSMGGLIARRYIAKYMTAATPDVRQLIMLGTPNGGSKTADALEVGGTLFDLAESLGITRFFPPAKELTTDFVEQFNRANPVPGNVKFYAIAGNYSCSAFKKLPTSNPIESSPNDVVVWRESVFAIAEHGRWTYPSQQTAGCEGDHRGMRSDAANEGGQVIFSLFVSPLLRGQMPETPPELQTVASQADSTQVSGNAQEAIQFTNVQTSTLQPGGRLEFSRTPEPGPNVSFIVVGRPDQMTISLRDPNGQIITPDTTDPNVQFMQMGADFMPITSYTISNPVPGVWTTVIEANSQTPTTGVGVAAFGSLVSDLRLTLPVAESIPIILQGVNLTAQLRNDDAPLVGANVHAQLIFPDHTVTPVTLLDDGLHSDGSAGDGRYGYQFTPIIPGLYSALINAEGINGDITFQRSAVWVIQVDGNQVFLPVVLHL